MALNILAELQKLVAAALSNEPDDATANGIGESGDEVDENGEPIDDVTTEGAVEPPAAEAGAPEAGTGDTNATEAEVEGAQETLPESEVATAELRDSLGRLGSENERLRDLVVSLGGDPTLDEEGVVEEDVVEDEVDDEYDDEAAQADLDEQHRQIAALSHK